MASKPNHRFERLERERLKKAKKEEKSRRQQERTAHAHDRNNAAPIETAPPES